MFLQSTQLVISRQSCSLCIVFILQPHPQGCGVLAHSAQQISKINSKPAVLQPNRSPATYVPPHPYRAIPHRWRSVCHSSDDECLMRWSLNLLINSPSPSPDLPLHPLFHVSYLGHHPKSLLFTVVFYLLIFLFTRKRAKYLMSINTYPLTKKTPSSFLPDT